MKVLEAFGTVELHSGWDYKADRRSGDARLDFVHQHSAPSPDRGRRRAPAKKRQPREVSAVDALIAAQTISARGRLFTLDEDFARIAPECNLELYRSP